MNLCFFIVTFCVLYFGKVVFTKMVVDIFALLFFIFGLLGMIIFPIIFNFFIYPKVEIRLGIRLLDWGPAVQVQRSGKYFLSGGVFSMYVLREYFMLKFSQDFDVALQKWSGKKSVTLIWQEVGMIFEKLLHLK